MKETSKRLAALLLAMSMSLSLLSANVWAAEVEPADGSVSAQSSEELAPGDEAPAEEESAPEEEAPAEESAPEEGAPEEEESTPEEGAPEEEDFTPEESAPAEEESKPKESASAEEESEPEEEASAGEETSAEEEQKELEQKEALTPQAVRSGSCGEHLSWELDPVKETLTISGTGTMSDYDTTTEERDDDTIIYNVSSSAPWQTSKALITRVVLTNGVTSIGTGAFYGCENLTSVELPSTLTKIGQRAFFKCKNLSDVTIPNSVSSIDKWAFQYCETLTNVTLPDKLTSIEESTFRCCFALKHVVIPSGVTSIGAEAFSTCSVLDGVELPSGLQSIGARAFIGCDLLSSIVIPDSVNSIGKYAFADCDKLNQVTLPSGLCDPEEVFAETPWGTALCHMDDAEPVSINESKTATYYKDGEQKWYRFTVPSNGAYTYEYQYSSDRNRFFDDTGRGLNTVFLAETGRTYLFRAQPYYDVDEGQTSMQYTFKLVPVETSGKCGTNLNWSLQDGTLTISGSGEMTNAPWSPFAKTIHTVVLPDGLTGISDRAFSGCSQLSAIDLPAAVATIGSGAFYGCESLEAVSLPQGMTTIREYAFSNCKKLSTVQLSGSLTTIEEGAFYHCEALAQIALPQGLQSIGYMAFYHCAFESIDIPATVTFIPGYAFAYNDNLATVTMGSQTSYDKTAFKDTPWFLKRQLTDAPVIYVGETKKIDCPNKTQQDFFSFTPTEDAYYLYTLVNGSTYNTSFVCNASGNRDAVEGYFSDYGDYFLNGFWGVKGRTYYLEANYLNFDSDGGGTYSVRVVKCNAPNSGTLENGMKWNVSNGVLSITGSGEVPSFRETLPPWTPLTAQITALSLGSGVTGIGANAFQGLYWISSVELPEGLKAIGDGAFSNHGTLVIGIPESVETISEKAFGSSKGLTIAAPAGSTAHVYAKEHGIDFTTTMNHVHSYDAPVWTWSADHKSASAQFSCVASDDTQNVQATVSGKTTPASCGSVGQSVYTAKVSFQGKEYTDSKTVNLPATGTHTWDGGKVTKAATYTVEGVKTYTCTVCHQTKTESIAKLPKVANAITGTAAFTKTTNAKKAQTFNLGARANGAPLSYKSNNKKVTIAKNGKVTIKKGFVGKAIITITAAETDQYLPTQKQVTVTVNPSATQLSSVKWDAKKKVANISWAKNTTGKGYEIQVSRQKNFKKVEKKAVIKTNATVKTTISGLKKGTYYFHMRTVNGKNYSAWSKVKTLKIAK